MTSFLPRATGSERASPSHGEEPLGRVLRRLQEALHQGGLDLLQPFSLGALAAGKVEHPRFSSHGPTQLGLVIGNTRALWAAFLRHLRGLGVRSPDELGPDPLDIYVEELVHGALSDLGESCSTRSAAVFSHELSPAPIPIQRIAAMSGLGQIGPAHLSVHAEYGTWWALRAVVALALPASAGAFFDTRPTGSHPCERCDAPCRRALSGALLHRDVRVNTDPKVPSALSDRQRRWLHVRDACPIGTEHRYSEAQILYHYSGKKDALFGKVR